MDPLWSSPSYFLFCCTTSPGPQSRAKEDASFPSGDAIDRTPPPHRQRAPSCLPAKPCGATEVGQRGVHALMLLCLGKVPTRVASSSHAAQQVLCTHDKSFASRPLSIVGDMLAYGPLDVGFTPYGEWWRWAR
ncbi:hypothetical protein U9M48_008754 [Paspalum notatum var. saurae]|uniref:Uncharacterized protein n=1 Tax=Paspalum notatum var. saurae TaxID=547442 RepID=A0AAQ3WDU6_PASNO